MSRALTYTTSWAWLGLTDFSYTLVKLIPCLHKYTFSYAFTNTLSPSETKKRIFPLYCKLLISNSSITYDQLHSP